MSFFCTLSFWRVSFQNSISTILTVGNYMQISDAFSDRGCFLEWNPLFVAHMGQKWFKNNKYPWFEKQFISGCFCWSIISIRLHFWSQLVYLVCLNMQRRRRRGTCDIPLFMWAKHNWTGWASLQLTPFHQHHWLREQKTEIHLYGLHQFNPIKTIRQETQHDHMWVNQRKHRQCERENIWQLLSGCAVCHFSFPEISLILFDDD